MRTAREKAAASHVVIINHALLLSDLTAGGTVIPDYDVLIILCSDTGSDPGDIVDSKVDSTGDATCPTPAPAGEAPHFVPINPLQGRQGPFTVTVTRP
ncbi:MAG: hypothetical protein IIA41_12335 [SAR324 cluster bacterium]|nr:hypothetical protein [SAR324 cluster bacterium]